MCASRAFTCRRFLIDSQRLQKHDEKIYHREVRTTETLTGGQIYAMNISVTFKRLFFAGAALMLLLSLAVALIAYREVGLRARIAETESKLNDAATGQDCEASMKTAERGLKARRNMARCAHSSFRSRGIPRMSARGLPVQCIYSTRSNHRRKPAADAERIGFVSSGRGLILMNLSRVPSRMVPERET